MKLGELATAPLFGKQMRKATANYQRSRKTIPSKEEIEDAHRKVLEENRQLQRRLEQLQKEAATAGLLPVQKKPSPKKEGSTKKVGRFTIISEGGEKSPIYTGPRGGKFTYVQGKKAYIRK